MYFKKTDIQTAKKCVLDRAEMLNVMWRKDDKERFNKTLNNIRKSKQYREGETIDPKHWNALKNNVNIAIDNLSKHLIKNIHQYREYVDYANPVEYLATAVDSLYITAMEELGCPDMSLFHFDKDIKKTMTQSAINIHRNYVTYSFSKQETFQQQRGKDAVEVAKNFDRLVKGMQGAGKAESIGKMIAEYQALKERQRNHNVFWRAFHRGENKARNELLQKMSETIQKGLPKGMEKMDLDKVIPAEAARRLADARIRGEVEVAGPKRYDSQTLTQVFGCSPAPEDLDAQYKILDEVSQKEQMSKNANFLYDIIGMDDNRKDHGFKEEAVNNDKVIVKDNNEFSLFN